VLTALGAGALAGVLVFAAHMMATSPLILAAEVYETTPAPGHGSTAAASDVTANAEAALEGWERGAYTLLADILTSIGFAFVLVGAIALSGREVDWRRGLIWGLCGFAAVSVAPALGLAPELPGMQAADLQNRQVWWLGTAATTAGGLALIFLGERPVLKVLGAVLIVLPHVIGAPAGHELRSGAVPAELAAEFAVATLVVSGLFWLLLGGLTGHFYRRFESA
jgi:cobalt transporter subunit CbtA